MPLLHSFTSLLPALVVFGVLIIVHEFGHFIACRLSKVRVEKFSIGFGPELLHWQAKETRFSISLFPLGGFVSPAGEEASKVGPEGPKPGDFLAASVLSRIFIVVSGVCGLLGRFYDRSSYAWKCGRWFCKRISRRG